MKCISLFELQVVLAALFATACAAPAASDYGYINEPAHISLPPPKIETRKEPDQVHVTKGAPVVNEQIHYGTSSYVSGYNTILKKPRIPDISIDVPRVILGTSQVNPTITNVRTELHTVNEPYPVERPYDAPYEVIKNVERVVEVPQPYKVVRPVPVPQPYPVQGAPIIKKTVAPPLVQHTHSHQVAPPVVQRTHSHSHSHSESGSYGSY